MREKKSLYISFDEFFENFVGLYHIVDEREKCFVKKYLFDLEKAICNDSLENTVFFLLPKGNIEIIKECLSVNDDIDRPTRISLASRFNTKPLQLDYIMKDFYLTLRNDVYKILWNRRYCGMDFGTIYNSSGLNGIYELGLSRSKYFLLKELHFNSIQDLTSICTHKLYSFRGIGFKLFTDILTAVHDRGFKFSDEKEIDIERLKKMDAGLFENSNYEEVTGSLKRIGYYK